MASPSMGKASSNESVLEDKTQMRTDIDVVNNEGGTKTKVGTAICKLIGTSPELFAYVTIRSNIKQNKVTVIRLI